VTTPPNPGKLPRGNWWLPLIVNPGWWPIIKEVRKTVRKRRKHKK
jgi:hypothetical protein